MFCGRRRSQRKCLGGVFKRSKPGGFVFNGENHNDDDVTNLSEMFNNPKVSINSQYSGSNRHIRTIVQQWSEYENGYNHACCFANNPAGVWVGYDESDWKPNNHNELPHEFGHTYNQPDYAGKATFATKSLSYALRVDNTIDYPYNSKNVYKYSAMNGNKNNDNPQFLSSLSDFELANAERSFLVAKTIDDRIKIDDNLSTTIVLVSGKDVRIYRINAFIPSFVDEIKDKSQNDKSITLIGYNSRGQIKKKITHVIDGWTNSVFALSQDFYDVNGGYILSTFAGVTRKFFVRKDALIMPNPVKGVIPSVWKNIKEKQLKTNVEILSLNDPIAMQNYFTNYYHTYAYLNNYDNSIKQISLSTPLSTSEYFMGTLSIHNKRFNDNSTNQITINYDKSSLILKPNETVFFVYNNIWRETNQSNTKNRKKLSEKEAKKLSSEPVYLTHLFESGYTDVMFDAYNGHWTSPIIIHVVNCANFTDYTVTVDVGSQYDVNVIVQNYNSYNLKKGQSLRLTCVDGWTYKISNIMSDETDHNRNIYNVPPHELTKISTDKDLIYKLFDKYKGISVNFTGIEPYDVNNFTLPDLSIDNAGKLFIINKKTDRYNPVVIHTYPGKYTTLYSEYEFTYVLTSPWDIISQSGDISPNNDIRKQNIQNIINDLNNADNISINEKISNSSLTKSSTVTINTQNELVKLADCTKFYIVELLKKYDRVIINPRNGIYKDTICLQTPNGYYDVAGRIVEIVVDSWWSVDVNFGIDVITMEYQSRMTLLLESGWKLIKM